jgi:hypothetical protein
MPVEGGFNGTGEEIGRNHRLKPTASLISALGACSK